MGKMTVRESEIELSVCAWAESSGWISRKIAYVGRRGCPDRLFVGHGQVVFMELKRPGKSPDPLQAREHRRFAERGVTIHVIEDIEEGISVLREAMR